MARIAAVVITKNEESILPRCLTSLKDWVSEIIIVDDHSADRTVEIARDQFGAKVVVRALNQDFDEQRNAGLAVAESDWILQLDADEVVPPEAREKIVAAIAAADKEGGFEILRRDCVFDKPLTYRGSCFQPRILRRGRGRNAGGIHEELIVDGPVGRIEAEILHYNFSSVQNVIAKNNFYTEIECLRYFEEHDTVAWKDLRWRILYKAPKNFYKQYVKNKAYRDGPHGFLRAALNTLHLVILWLKILEKAVKEDRLR